MMKDCASDLECAEHLRDAWWESRLKSLVERCMQAEMVVDRKGEWTGHYQFDASTALKALEILGKHYGLFDKKPNEPEASITLDDAALDEEIRALMKLCGYEHDPKPTGRKSRQKTPAQTIARAGKTTKRKSPDTLPTLCTADGVS